MTMKLLLWTLLVGMIILSGSAGININIIADDNEAPNIIEPINAVLGASPQDRDFVIVAAERNSFLGDVSKLRAPWGVGVFEIPNHDDVNTTRELVWQMVSQARQLRVVSWSATVVVVSDDPAFLTTFTEWSLKGRLLVWSTRLLVLTRLPLHHLHHLRNTLAMTNSVLLYLIQNPAFKVNIYVEEPYRLEGSRPLSLASWTPGKGLGTNLATPFFSNKFFRLSQRPRLVVSRVVASTEKTATIDDPDHPGEQKIIGLNAEHQLIETIAESLNFTIKYLSPADQYWGNLNSEGVWTGMIGMIFRKEADIALGLFTMTPIRHTVVDFTYPVAISYARILAGRGSPEVTVWAFLLPLMPEVWLGICLALVVYMLVMVLPACLPIQSLRLTKLATGAFSCVRVLLQQDVCDRTGWWWWERVVVGVWMLMTLVLTKSYAGNLMSQLAVRNIPEPYQSLEDLLDSTVKVYLLKGTAEEAAFRFSTGGLKQAVWNLKDQNRIGRLEDKDLAVFSDVLLQGGSALINLDVYHKKRMADEFARSGKCVFSLGRSRYIPALDSMAVAKDSPLVPALSRKVMQISEAGLYDHWQTVFFPNLTSCLHSPTKFAIMTPLAIGNIWGIFVVLAGGFLVSLFIFLLEVYCHVTHSPN